MQHVKGFPTLDPPALSVAKTEIPDVRSYLFSLPYKAGKVNSLKLYCVHIRSLLSQMELSCIGFKPMMKRDNLLKVVVSARNVRGL